MLGKRGFHISVSVTECNSWSSNTLDRKSTRLNSSHITLSYAVFCLKKKNQQLSNLKHNQKKWFEPLIFFCRTERSMYWDSTSYEYNCSNGIHLFFFFNDTATTEIYTLSLHDALPICYGCFVESSKKSKNTLFRLQF